MSEIASSTEEQVDQIHSCQSIENSICYDSDSNSHHHAKKNKNQNSNSTKSCKVITNPLLFEDLRIHIFTFVPLNHLLDSIRYVCKPWAETIGSSHFAQVCERRRAHSKLGLYVQNLIVQEKSYFLEFKDYVNGQFERTHLGTPRGMGCVIGTCDGMLLLRNYNSKQIFFVNPILKCWLRLPDYSNSQRRYIIFQHQSTVSRVPRTGKFKLFLADSIEVLGVFWYVLYVLRIGIDNSWKEIFRKEAPLQQHFLCQTLSGDNDNNLYWITNEVVFLIDVDKEIIVRVSKNKEEEIIVREWQFSCMPIVTCEQYLLMGDHLSCIMSKDYVLRTFQIYILNFDSGKWSLYHEMGPLDYEATCGDGHGVISESSHPGFRLWINDEIIFEVTLDLYPKEMETSRYIERKMHLSYNVKTRQLTKIVGIHEGKFDVWFHINTLISLPNTII